MTTRDDGDFNLDHVAPSLIESQRRTIVDLPWTMPREVHGTDVVVVDSPGAGDGCTGDVVFTSLEGVALGVWTGDCAAVAIVGASGSFALVHAGWRGLAAGVIDRAASAFGAERPVTAMLGPCIRPCCYEFGADDLTDVADGVHAAPESISARTRWDTPALDVPAAVAHACEHIGASLHDSGVCTGCDERFFSHRRRGELGRHLFAAWRWPGAR